MQFNIITQPYDGDGNHQTFGDKFISSLSSDNVVFSHIYIVSAFANRRAVLRLIPHLLLAKDQGTQIRITVGIDHRGTSVEALQNIISLDVDAIVFNNPVPGHTFHPKIYLVEGEEAAELFVGSNNLTEGGLYTNYEAFTYIRFDLPSDYDIYQEVFSSLSRFINPLGSIALPLTNELLQTLIVRGDVVSESSRRFVDDAISESGLRKKILAETTPEETLPESPFQSERIPNPPHMPTVTLPRPYFERLGSVTPSREAGPLLWRKENLPRSDVQRQRGNVTGGLRLTQAGWEVDGTGIDHTQYFRHNLFGDLDWSVGVHPPLQREVTLISAEIVILGTNYGVHQMTVSHKPSGEAGQRNYTTMLHWGEIAALIQELNLVGKNFYLYAPSEEDGGPFRMEITD